LREQYRIEGVRDLETRWVRYVQARSTKDALVAD
jgi:hypothetical protein